MRFSRRRRPELPPSSVDCDDGGEIGDWALGGRTVVGAANDKFLEATEERGKAGAAPKSDNAEAGGKSFRFGRAIFHG